MSRKRIGGAAHDSSMGHGGDRPWVYFMVDCFFLITEFFVLTFKFKQEESVLPQRMPPGGTKPPQHVPVVLDNKTPLQIHVAQRNQQTVYNFMQRDASEAELQDALSRIARSGPEKYLVRVSYDAGVQWGDVMKVFNACNKYQFTQCGLQPLRGAAR
jgi:biopolymer transport protein ExbD